MADLTLPQTINPACLITHTGQVIDLSNPQPQDIHLEDIAHGLAHVCRFSGQCKEFYSVAEHSVITSTYVSGSNAAWALLHDASEAYLGDVPSPAKALCPCYQALEDKLMAAVAVRFGLPPVMPEGVHLADRRALLFEWSGLKEKNPGWNINALPPAEAKELFLSHAASREAEPT